MPYSAHLLACSKAHGLWISPNLPPPLGFRQCLMATRWPSSMAMGWAASGAFCHLRTGRGAGTAAAFSIKPLTGQEVRACNLLECLHVNAAPACGDQLRQAIRMPLTRTGRRLPARR